MPPVTLIVAPLKGAVTGATSTCRGEARKLSRGSNHLLKQPHDLALLERPQWSERRPGDLMGKGGRFLGDAVPFFRRRDHAPPAVFRVDLDRHKLSQPEPVDDALDRVGIEID